MVMKVITNNIEINFIESKQHKTFFHKGPFVSMSAIKLNGNFYDSGHIKL